MFRIATNSQFAVAIHILVLLSQLDVCPLTSEVMASSINTNPVFVRRILGLLSRAGLVGSQPGVGGGWRLQRDAGDITLLDVHRAIDEKHLIAMPHSKPNPDCLIGRNIERALTLHFEHAENAFEQALAQQTIADVLHTAIEDSSTRV